MSHSDVRSSLRSKFLDDTAAIPSWMFIQWIPQLLAAIGASHALLAQPIILRLAKEYPQAIYFPFNLSRESYKGPFAPKTAATQQADRYLKSIEPHLHHRLLGMFVKGLDYLGTPELKLKDLVRSMKSRTQQGDIAGAQREWQEFRARHFSANGGEIAKTKGAVYDDFQAKWKEFLDKLFDPTGSKLATMAASKIDWMKDVDKRFNVSPPIRPTGKTPLATYCTWFGQFEKYCAATGDYIELPGQYTGKSRPQPDLHVRIVNFDPQILVMSSLRRPKRLTVNGSDERSHHYLVKLGEDLRMDQRVEQTFATMNEILATNAATQRRQLALRTYQVVPMTSTLGMLEWVNSKKKKRTDTYNCELQQMSAPRSFMTLFCSSLIFICVRYRTVEGRPTWLNLC